VDVRTARFAEEILRTRARLDVLNHPGHDQKSHGRKGSGGGPGSGKDLVGTVDDYDDRFQAVRDLVAQQGFDGPPVVTDAAGVDAVVAAGGLELFRGTSAEHAEEFRTGEMHLSGRGSSAFGIGVYTSTREAAEPFAGEGGLSRMALSPNAKTITYRQLAEERRARYDEMTDAETALYQDDGAYAAGAGYDAVIPDGGTGHWLILNRTALTVQQESAN
jgi:hypothetical protein